MSDRTVLENFRLTVFRTLAEKKNFRRAAEQLYLTQPAVTQQVKALEQEIGAPLFDRTGREVVLTPAGHLLLRYANESDQILRRAEQEVTALHGHVSGSLRLAVSTTIAQYVLPPLLARFLERHPAVELAMRSANTEEVASAVLDGSADLGLIEGPVHRPELKPEHWMRDRLVLVVPRDHPWAGLPSIRLEHLPQASLLLRERGSGTRQVVETAIRDAFEQARLPPPDLIPAMELNSTEAILACVEAGLGVAFCSRAAITRQVRLGTLASVTVKALRIARDLSFLTLRNTSPRGNAAVLLDFLREQTPRKPPKP